MCKTHLDVGFTDLAAAVRRRYLEDFFPRALAVAAELRAAGGPARLRWTAGSWILTEALDAAGAARRRELEAAIDAGDLCWHALPFTTHTEYCDRSLLEHGLSLSAELDRRYGRRTVAAKLTDVPGHTRGLVSLLADAGVELLHVGVNPASAAPSAPRQFRWVDPAAVGVEAGGGTEAVGPEAVGPERGGLPEILVMYQPGGYGAVQTIPGTGTAVAVGLTGDNLGPMSAEEVVAAFDALATRFPGAQVRAASLDDVAAVMSSARDRLPVVTAEIGDTWIHGVASDPAKTVGFRALCRERARWLEDGDAQADEPALRAASTRLLLVAEHTWGLDQKTHWPEEGHWSVDGLAAVRDDAATVRFESSWAEQRAYLGEFVDALDAGGRADLAARAANALAIAEAPGLGAPDGLDPVTAGEPVRIGGFEVTLDPADGAVVGLVDGEGVEWASPEAPLGRWRVQTFDAGDFERWFSTYNAATLPEDEWWARWDNTKPGLHTSGARHATWAPRLTSVHAGRGIARDSARDGARDSARDVLVATLGFDAEPGAPVALPSAARICLSPGERPDELDVELSWQGLPAARWPVAWWWTFAPAVGDPARWRMSKLGEWVSPDEVVCGGGADLHAVDRLTHPAGARIELWDTPLVAPGEQRLLDWRPDEERSARVLGGRWHVCVHANLWGTNFPMWTEGQGHARVTLTLRRPPA